MRTGAEDCEELIIVVGSVWQIRESNQQHYLDGWEPQHLSWARPTLALLLPSCSKRDFCQLSISFALFSAMFAMFWQGFKLLLQHGPKRP